MANEKRLIYLEDAIALFEQDIEENKIALRTAYHGDKDAIRSEMVGMRAAISLVNSLARNGFTVDAVEVVHGRWIVDKERLIATCSECGKILRFSDEMQIAFLRDEERFCYYCGAKMDGDEDG